MFFIWTFHHPYLLYFVHGTLAAAEPLEVDWSSRLLGTYQSKPSSAGSSDFCRPCAINYKCLRTNGAQQQTHATRVSRCWRGWSRDWTWPWWQMMRRRESRWGDADPEQGKGHFFLQCWRGSSASESECLRRRRLLWGYLLLMTRKLTTESEAGLACSTFHVAYAPCVCVCVRVCCLSVFRYRASVASNDSKTMPAVCWLLDACLFARLCRDFPRPSFFVVFLLFLAFHLRHRQTRHINELWSLHRVQCMKCILSLAGIMRRNYRQRGKGG